MKRSLLAVGVLVVVAPIVFAQRPAPATDYSAPTGRPEDVGTSSERLGRVKAAMQRYVDRGEVPGVVTLIARHGRVVHFESIGNRDVEARAPMTPDTIFRLASMTKPIVSAAAMSLYEQGEFQLSDPISRWIPEFENMKVIEPGVGGNYTLKNARTPITIRHLLTQIEAATGSIPCGADTSAAEADWYRPRPITFASSR